MAWCRKATSHSLTQCWSRFMLQFGVTRPQWHNRIRMLIILTYLSRLPVHPEMKNSSMHRPLGFSFIYHNICPSFSLTNLFNDWKYIYMLIWSAPSGVFMTPTSSALAAPYIVIPKTSSATSDGKLASRYLDFQCIENSFLCHLLCYKITVWPLVLTHRYVTQFINIPPSDYS